MLALYRCATDLGGPLIESVLRRRVARGKEDPLRLAERRGIAALPRPDGQMAWVHASSVGESIAALTLVDRLAHGHASRHVLMTSGTVSSARVLAGRLPARVLHQYVPLDRAAWVDRFLNHWRPDLAAFTEAEVWPHMVMRTHRLGIPTALVNARMSAESFRRWRMAGPFARPLFRAFDLVLATNQEQAGRFSRLGAPEVDCYGNLKRAATALPRDPAAVSALARAIGGRPLWLAASTHPGEEAAAIELHRRLRGTHPGLLTVIAPRHPDRGPEIAALAEAASFAAARRQAGALPDARTEIYVADTLGEMAALFELAPVVFVAGSLVPVGGHNPVEPAHFDCAILFGPLMPKNAEIAAEMKQLGAAREVADVDALAVAVDRLLSAPAEIAAMAAAARSYVTDGDEVLDRTVARLERLISSHAGRSGHGGR